MKTKLLLLIVMFFNTSLVLNLADTDTPTSKSNSATFVASTLKINDFLAQNTDCGAAAYEDVDGLVVIEAENLDFSGTQWNLKTDFSGFTGDGYLSWDGSNNYGSPGNGLITTQIKINTPGKYRFRWHSRIGMGSNSTEHNDSWLRFPDASDFYGEKNGNRLYPNGSGQTPNPNGSSSNGWFKVYLSGSTDWTWSTQTSDNDAHQIYVEFDTAGTYTMEISGRSKDHLINRITLSNDADDPLNLDNVETPCTAGALSLVDITDVEQSIKLWPNPASTYINIIIPNGESARLMTVYDAKGTVFGKLKIKNNKVDISHLLSGVYYAKTDNGYSLRFIVK